MTLIKNNVSTIYGITNLVEGSKRENIIYQMELDFIKMMLYILANLEEICSVLKIRNEYHIETMNEGNLEYLYISSLYLTKSLYWKNSRLSPLGCIIQQ